MPTDRVPPAIDPARLYLQRRLYRPATFAAPAPAFPGAGLLRGTRRSWRWAWRWAWRRSWQWLRRRLATT